MGESAEKMRPSPRVLSSRRWVVLALALGFGLWLFWMVGGELWRSSSARPWSVPYALGGLGIYGAATQGPEAVAQMARLHGKDVELKDGYVSHYRASGRDAVLYVGQAQSATAASDLTERMRALIARGGTPFQQLSQLTVDGRVIYRVVGLGAEHYFYTSDDKSIWLTVAGGGAEDVLRAALAEVG